MSDNPREWWIEIFELDPQDPMLGANCFHKKPVHWPNKPTALHLNLVSKAAYDAVAAELATTIRERDGARAALEDRDKMHSEHVNQIEAERLRLAAENERLREALEWYAKTKFIGDNEPDPSHRIGFVARTALKREVQE